MPAAELFAAVAVPWVVSEAAAFAVAAVCAIGDCSPAAAALNRGSSPKPPLRVLLLAGRRLTERWLGVDVPRDFNVDPDRLSHPSQLQSVIADVEAAGYVARVVSIHERHAVWETLRDAIRVSLT